MMAVRHVPATSEDAMARMLASILQKESVVERLWADSHRDYVEFWLLTAPTTADVERHLYTLSTQMHERYPDAVIRFHVINPRYFEDFDVTEIVPAQASEIQLLP
jgi:hypothetical protein